ncbi:MAG: hypothetical protein HYV07_11260 [Deltaproteobacteria bacterium]|nr:hypothetical protein [Deltaproteobacteria bacterium]
MNSSRRARLSTLALGLALGVISAPKDARAADSVGLGVGIGLAVPDSDLTNVSLSPALGWGFYTDIPLLSTFHITPSTIVYRLDPKDGSGVSATDVSLNFKFIVPLGPLDIFAGVTTGVTSATELSPHLGALAGASLNLIKNLDAFINMNYRITIRDDQAGNVRSFQIYVGPLFRFLV